MPKTIRQALLNQLQMSGTFKELKDDLYAIAGLKLMLIGSVYEPSDITEAQTLSPFCRQVPSCSEGRIRCRHCIENLALKSKAHPVVCGLCHAELTIIGVTLYHGGESLGFLFTGGYRIASIDKRSHDPSQDDAALIDYGSSTLVFSARKHEAIKRWLKYASNLLLQSLELHKGTTEQALPGFVIKICSVIQKRYKAPPSLKEAARICDLSEGYLSRAFHEHTGLRFVEYIHAVRLEHFCDLILDPEKSITEAAYEVGFQSLSQFNRVFKRAKGVAPRQWRNQNPVQVKSVENKHESVNGNSHRRALISKNATHAASGHPPCGRFSTP